MIQIGWPHLQIKTNRNTHDVLEKKIHNKINKVGTLGIYIKSTGPQKLIVNAKIYFVGI